MSNNLPVTIQGLSVTNSGNGGAIALNQSQANQLLQKLRSIQTSGSGSPQTIKIQAIQTNPTTGAKQIVAIPISASNFAQATSANTIHIGSSGINSGGSHPTAMQVLGAGSNQTITVNTTGTRASPNLLPYSRASPMKVIKIPASGPHSAFQQQISSENASNMPPGVKVVKLSAASSMVTNQRVAYTSQVVTPSKIVTSNMASIQHEQLVESRKRSDIDFDAFSDVKRRKSEKGGKGLRHFSMKVCEKVQAKGSTSYNEVADELVNELTDPRCTSPTDQQYDQKNIRRRVYDALNVLMAMNIISKEKKEIRWLGLPTNSVQEANGLEQDKAKRMDRIKAKTQQLQDLLLQQIAFKNLVERNKEREKREGPPPPNSAIQLPFIIVNTSKKTVIDCSISNDKMEYLFNFDDTFEIHDDMEVLKRMGLSFGLERGQVSGENLNKARTMVPRALEQYVVELAAKGPGNCSNMPKVSPVKILKEEVVERQSQPVMMGGTQSDHDTDSEVDIN